MSGTSLRDIARARSIAPEVPRVDPLQLQAAQMVYDPLAGQDLLDPLGTEEPEPVQKQESAPAAVEPEVAPEAPPDPPPTPPSPGEPPPPFLQLRGPGTGTHAAARAGITGTGGPLPFGEAIQQSFGHHDVGDVTAHTDSAAGEASRAMGARAYATGDHVAFAGTPDLHTTAHEAAHVVQQRSGVALKDGVGRVGDRYEQHADEVADTVVRGGSAEPLLDRMAGAGAGAPALQRKEVADDASGEGKTGDVTTVETKGDVAKTGDGTGNGAQLTDGAKTPDQTTEGKQDTKGGPDQEGKKEEGKKEEPKESIEGGGGGTDEIETTEAHDEEVVVDPDAQPVDGEQGDTVEPTELQSEGGTPDEALATGTGTDDADKQVAAEIMPLDPEQAAIAQLLAIDPSKVTMDLAGQTGEPTVRAFVAEVGQKLTDNCATLKGDVDKQVTAELARVDAAVEGSVHPGVLLAFQQAHDAGITATDTAARNIEKAYKEAVAQVGARATSANATLARLMSDTDAKLAQVKTQATKDYEVALQAGSKDVDATKKDGKARLLARAKQLETANDVLRKHPVGMDALVMEGRQSVAKGWVQKSDTTLAEQVAAVVAKVVAKLVGAAPSLADQAIRAQVEPLRQTVAAKRSKAQQAIVAARAQAGQKLLEAKNQALQALEVARGKIGQRTAAEADRALGRIEVAVNQRRDRTFTVGDDAIAAIDQLHADRQQLYDTVAAYLDKKSPVPAPLLTAVRDALADASSVHLRELESLAATKNTELAAAFQREDGRFATAVKGQHAEAAKFGSKLQSEAKASGDAFATLVKGVASKFSLSTDKAVAPVRTAASGFQKSAEAKVGKQKTKLVAGQVAAAKKGVKAEYDGLVKGLAAKLDAAGSKKAMSERGKLVVETRNLRDAMDGFGTDEAKIHGVLRRASYGGIEALKVLYDMRYTHRRGKKYNQALYDDLDDEMSGDDLRLALLYLKHSRKEAIALDLKMAVGFFNDDEARIEEIMRGCSLDEIKSLHSNGNAELIATVQSHLGGHDRDAFDALLKVGDPKWTEDEWKTRRSAEANAIRLHEAMDGMGTDEAKVLQLLEEAKTDEERKYLREYFKSYSDKKDWFPPKDLDDALSGELSGSDKMLATVLAKEKRDDDEVAAAKMLHAGSGMGTDEKKLFEAMKDPKFEAKISQFDTEIESLQKAMEGVKDKDQRAILQQRLDAKKKEKGKAIDERKATLGKHIATLSEGDYKNVDQYLSSELGSTSGKGDDNLERQMADKILEKGTVDRATQIRYASAGLGTNEDDLTAALTGDDGEPLSKAELAKLDAEYMQKYGKSIRTEVNGETAFTDAKGKVVSGGKTYKELDMLLDGKPETIQDLRTQAEKRKTIETSGFGATVGRAADWLGFTDTYTDYDAGHKRLMEELSSSEEKYRKAHPDKKDEPVKLSDLGTEMGGEGDRLMLLSQFDQGDAKAFGKFKESMVDSLVTVLEVIGAAVATILTAGAAAPALAAVLSSLVVSAVGIGFKYVMLGDNYLDQLGNDLMVALATAPLAALGELKAVGKVADKAGKGIGKNVGKVVNGIADAADKAGFKWVGKIRLSEKSIEKFSKLAGKGVSSVLTDTPTDAVTAALDEKSWDKGADEWGKNLLGSTMSSVGNNFKGGMIKGGVGGKFDEKWDEKLGPSKSYWMAGLKGASKATTVSTAKFMLDPSSYADDGNMLERFGKASLTASWKGAVNSAAERKSAIVGFERRMRRGEAIGEADYDTLSMMTEEELAGVANRLPAEKVPTALKGYRKPDASEKAKLEGTEDHEHDATTTKKADDKTSTKTEESPADVERRKTQLQMAEHAEALIHSGDHKGAAFVMEKLYLQLTHESMKDTPIGKVLLKATTHEEKMGIAAEYATYLAVMDKNPRDLDPDRMSAVIRTHSRLYQQLELGTTMRKFFSAEDTDAWLSQKYGAASVGGSVGVAKNTEGLDAHQVISVLGLDYTAGGKQPFLKPDGKPVDHVFFVEYSLTEAHKQQAKVPMDSKLVEHAKEMAAKGDKEAQTFLDQIHERDADYVKDEHGKPVLDEKGKPVRDYSNPFMGLGGTSHGSLFKGTSTKVGNQELQMMERQKLGEGTVMYALDQKGAKTKVAVLSIVEPGKPLKWVMDESLATTDPVLASQVQISLAKANEKD